jgi:hypothetical protein
MEDQNVKAVQSFEDLEGRWQVFEFIHHAQIAHFHPIIKSTCEVTEDVEDQGANQQEADDDFPDDREKSERNERNF